MANPAKLLIKVDVDSKNASRELDRTSDAFKGLGTAFKAAAGLFAVGAIIEGVKDVTRAASDLHETMGATNVIFGAAGRDVIKWSKTSATAFGLSQTAALDAANTFAIFGKSAGLTGDDLTTFSTQLVGLASDLASFKNTTPEEAVVALGAALRGESEPIRKYGILLDDASERQKALELGIISNTKNALTPQQRVLAVNALIWEQTGDAQNDFARTSEGVANQQRILNAQMENSKAAIGEAFLPMAQTLFRFLNASVIPIIQRAADALTLFIRAASGEDTTGSDIGKWTQPIIDAGTKVHDFVVTTRDSILQWWTDNRDRIIELKDKVVEFGTEWVNNIQKAIQYVIDNKDVFLPWAAGIGAVITAVEILTVVWGILTAIMAINPFILIAITIALLILWVALLWKNSEEFRDKVTAAWDRVKEIVVPILVTLRDRVKELWNETETGRNEMVKNLKDVWHEFQVLYDVSKPIIDWLLQHLPLVAFVVLLIVNPFLTLALVVIYCYLKFETFRNVVNHVINIVVWLIAVVLVGGIAVMVREIAAGIGLAIDEWNILWFVVSVIVGFIGSIIGPMWDGLTAGLRFAADEIRRIWNGVWSFVEGIVRDIQQLWSNISGPVSALSRIGGNIVGGNTLLPVTAAGLAAPAAAARAATVINVTVTHTGLGVDSTTLQRDLVTALDRYVARNGPLGLS